MAGLLHEVFMATGLMLDPGELGQRVTIREQTTVDDGLGGTQLGPWQDVATVWAKPKPKRGEERALAGANQASADYEIVIRRRDDVQEGMAVVWTVRGKAQTGNIRFISDHGPRAAYMVLEVEFGTSEDAA